MLAKLLLVSRVDFLGVLAGLARADSFIGSVGIGGAIVGETTGAGSLGASTFLFKCISNFPTYQYKKVMMDEPRNVKCNKKQSE